MIHGPHPLEARGQDRRAWISGWRRARGARRSEQRALRTVAAASAVLLTAHDEPELVAAMCATVVDAGGYWFCWYGRRGADPEGLVQVAAMAGDSRATSMTSA